MGCGAETEANELLTTLTNGLPFEIPQVNLNSNLFNLPNDASSGMYSVIQKISNADLSQTTIDGSGTFDVLMRAFKSHLNEEFEKGRITGAEYSKAYTTLTQNAMASAVQFLLGRDQAYWAAQLAQVQAITARVQLEMAKVQLAQVQFEALNFKANYALTKMKLSSESMTYCISKYNLENILPAQLQLAEEQIETQRSQTLDTRTDGSPVVGSVGKQKDLYSQQITSYERDAEVKAAKMFTDAWITQKTIDEGLVPPSGFTNASVDDVLSVIKANNGF